MAALPYMQLYVADYLADTAHLTTEEHGAYLLMLFSYWQTGKPLRADRLASVARLSNERWADVEKTLKDFFHVKAGSWTHFRVEADLEKVDSKSRKNSDAGKASARARALAKQELEEPPSTDVPTNVEQTYQRNVNHARSGDTDTDTDTEDLDQKPSAPPKKPAAKKPKAEKSDAPEFELPAWIDREAWDDFVAMRKSIKKPLTAQAQKLAVKKLEQLALQGHAPAAVLNQSTFHSWQGIFEVKNGTGQNTNRQGSGTGRLSLVDQVIKRNQERAAERAGTAGSDFEESAELFAARMAEDGGGLDFEGEFSRISVIDGKIMAADD